MFEALKKLWRKRHGQRLDKQASFIAAKVNQEFADNWRLAQQKNLEEGKFDHLMMKEFDNDTG